MNSNLSHRNEPKLGTLPLWAKIALGVAAVSVASAVVASLRERRLPNLDAETGHTHPRPGDVLLFYRPRRGRDYIIRVLTHSPFYHAALFDSPGYVLEARPAGVGRNSLAGREDGFVIVPAPEGKGADALAWARTQIGAHFDRKDFVVIFLEHLFVGWHINYAPLNRYTCAELVTKAFRSVGFDPFPGRENSEIDPTDWAKFLPVANGNEVKQARELAAKTE